MKTLIICLLILVQDAGDWQKPLEELRRARTTQRKLDAIQALSASGADNLPVLRTLLVIASGDKVPKVRDRASNAVAQLSPELKQATDVIYAKLSSDKFDEMLQAKSEAVRNLGPLAPAAMPVLCRCVMKLLVRVGSIKQMQARQQAGVVQQMNVLHVRQQLAWKILWPPTEDGDEVLSYQDELLSIRDDMISLRDEHEDLQELHHQRAELLLYKYQVISEMLRLIAEVILEEDSDVAYFLWQLCDLRADPIMTHAPLKTPEAVDTYLQGIEMVRSTAQEAVKEISKRHPSLGQLLAKEAANQLHHPDSEIQLLSMELLAKAGKASRSSLPDLQRLVERDPSPAVRESAQAAIDTIENDKP
ncbi:MAG: hypothetical protein MUC43_09480 [Pirellula sp.]|jgi:hypothetical protein|nr:hypothetical protein [Pirellula sp.]